MRVTGTPPRRSARLTHMVYRFTSRMRAIVVAGLTGAIASALLLALGAQAASADPTPYGLTFDPSHAVLVSMNGSDSTGQGTENNPYRTIGKGIQVATPLHENVYVAGSPLPYIESVAAVSDVSGYGGF